jgi:hypothetical protein
VVIPLAMQQCMLLQRNLVLARPNADYK